MNKILVRGFLSLFASALVAHAAQAYVIHRDYKIVDGAMEEWQTGATIDLTEGGSTTIKFSKVTSGMMINEWRLYKNIGLGGYQSYETLGSGTSITIAYNKKYEQSGETWYLVPCFEYVTYTLSYDPNGGEWTAGAPEGGTYKYNESVTAPDADRVEKDNATPTGWKSQSGKSIAVGGTFSGSSLGITSDGQAVVLYAQWEAKTYNVTLYVPTDAEVDKIGTLTKAGSKDGWDYFTTTYTYGKGMTLPKATTSKAGTTPVGWYDNPTYENDPESKIYGKVTKISKTDEGDMEFWGKFETELAIHYDGNGSSKGTMEDQEFTAGESISLDRNKFEKVYTVKFKLNGASGTAPANQTADYTFAHWNTAKDGTGDSYEDGQTVTFDEPVTLYAHWEEEKDAITLPEAPTWSGHTFSGWYTQQSGGTCVGYANDKYAPTGNITLYAHWDGQGDLSAAVGLTNATLTTWCTKKSSYSGGVIEWKEDAEGGVEKTSCLVFTPEEDSKAGATAVLAMNVTGPGFVTFKVSSSVSQKLGFYNGKGDVEAIPLEGATSEEDWTTVTKSVASGAVQVRWEMASEDNQVWLDDITWTPTGSTGKFTITAEPSDWAGGTVTGGGTYDKDDKVTLKAKLNTGWKFLGWRKNSDAAIVSTENPYAVEVTTNAAYTAVLADEWYYIAYNKNGGTGTTMDKQLAVRDQPTTLNANTYTKTGCVFDGWKTAKNEEYVDGATVTNLALSGSTVTLYAQWKSGSEEEEKEEEEKEEEEEVLPEPGPYASAVGEAVSVDLAADCAGWTIKSVSGLPTGLKYNKSTGLVTGTPTKAVSKENNVTITFTDKTKVKATWTVEALPAMMVGTYWGAATVDGIAGQFQLKLTAAGKATGYFYAAGKKITLKSTALVAEGEDCYTVAVTYTYNRVKHADAFLLMNIGAVGDADLWMVSLGDESEVLDDAEATRDVFKETGTKLTAATYVVEDESLEEGDALKAKVTAKGVVKVSGKAADADGNLVSVTGSTQLVFDEEGGLYCWITIYKAVRGKDPIERCFKWYLPEE